MAKKQRIFHQN